MADAWYYARDDNRIGPFSGRQLRDLATLGEILSTDTVWKLGVEKGVLAGKVKNLFSLPAAISLEKVPVVPQPLISEPVVEKVVAVVAPEQWLLPEEVPEAVPPKPAAAAQAAAAPAPYKPNTAPRPKNGRAMAISGAEIFSQDGTHAKYRKICTECGHKDSSCQTITISNMTTKTGYYCPKCKRQRSVVVQCTLG
jgi:hypothetical protein